MTDDELLRTLVMVPTYNEASGIASLLGQVLAAHPTLEVLVIDDGSPDGTGAIAEDFAARSDRVTVMHRTSKQGLGKAYVAGFRAGLDRGFDLLIEMDADLSHDPGDLPRLIAAAGDADLVIGSRYIRGGGVEGWSRGRHLLSRTANLYSQVLLGLPIRDSTSGFRCYRRKVIESLDLDDVASNGYAFQIEMAFSAWRNGFEVREVPIVFRERTTGRSKMSKQIVAEGIIWVTRTGVGSLAYRMRRRRGR
ncbi:MAG TPA: polyprenol monophosphomannose synthase [Actinomycetota bacterium]|nr:polyprenol monophosphomannose synthase [Actinomycetota bacterium]